MCICKEMCIVWPCQLKGTLHYFLCVCKQVCLRQEQCKVLRASCKQQPKHTELVLGFHTWNRNLHFLKNKTFKYVDMCGYLNA
jgi:hypothetical protein